MSRPMGVAQVELQSMGPWSSHSVISTEVDQLAVPEDGAVPMHIFHAAGITKLYNKYPLKVFIPAYASQSMCKWVYMTSYGGGLVEADDLHLSLDVQENCCCLLTTQAATKVYHCETGKATQQTITCSIGPAALLAIIPDPVIPFKNAIYIQKQKVNMHLDSNLVLLDWQTAGRAALGELWQFAKMSMTNEVLVSDEVVFRDAVCLQDLPFIKLSTSMCKYQVMGSLLLLGPLLEPLMKKLLAQIGKHKNYEDVYSCESMRSISPLQYNLESGKLSGCIVRFMGPNLSQVQKDVEALLKPLFPVLGGNPLRK